MEVSDPHVAAYRGGSARLRREQGGSMTGYIFVTPMPYLNMPLHTTPKCAA